MNPKGYIVGEAQGYRYEPAPLGQKVLLLTRGGICTIGQWQGALGQYFLGWAPLPFRDQQREAELDLEFKENQ